ncbi:MAG: hypothetical protein NVSMB38_40200 [Ktedonobacteraceae bacterium]
MLLFLKVYNSYRPFQVRYYMTPVFLPLDAHWTHEWVACMSSRRISWCMSGSTSTSLASYANSEWYCRERVSMRQLGQGKK